MLSGCARAIVRALMVRRSDWSLFDWFLSTNSRIASLAALGAEAARRSPVDRWKLRIAVEAEVAERFLYAVRVRRSSRRHRLARREWRRADDHCRFRCARVHTNRPPHRCSRRANARSWGRRAAPDRDAATLQIIVHLRRSANSLRLPPRPRLIAVDGKSNTISSVPLGVRVSSSSRLSLSSSPLTNKTRLAWVRKPRNDRPFATEYARCRAMFDFPKPTGALNTYALRVSSSPCTSSFSGS